MLRVRRGPLAVTLRIEGLTANQMSKVHATTETALTEVAGCPAKGDKKNVPGNSGKVLVIEKAEWDHREKTYTALIRINPFFGGHIHHPDGDFDATVYPSRESLGALFDVLGMLPDQEKVEKQPNYLVLEPAADEEEATA